MENNNKELKLGYAYGLKGTANMLLEESITNFIVAPFDKDGNELQCGEVVIQYKHFSPDEFIRKYQKKIDKGDKDSLTVFLNKELKRTGALNLQNYRRKEDSKIEFHGDAAVKISDYPKKNMCKIYADEQKVRKFVEHPNAEKFFPVENFRLVWPFYDKHLSSGY